MSNRTQRALAALLVTLPLAACGGGASDPGQLTSEGYQALGSGDAKAALEDFQTALAGLEAGTPEYQRAKMGEIEALIQLDPKRAQETMLALGSAADESQYATVGNKLTGAGHFLEAIAVLDAGMKRYAESPKLKALLDQVKVEAEKQGDSGALDALKGLGYL